jgi:cephalosporin hydroxylase
MPFISKSVVDQFHYVWYHQPDDLAYSWLGFPIIQHPMDMWTYQAIINKTKPQCIVSTGIYYGGMLMYLWSLSQLVQGCKNMKIIGIDIDIKPMALQLANDAQIIIIQGNSVDPDIISRIDKIRGDLPTMVILDSDHGKSHVLKEIQLYNHMVTPGQYMIVEDTDLNGHPVYPLYGYGPYEALEEFQKTNNEYIVDTDSWKLNLFTCHTWLKKKEKDTKECQPSTCPADVTSMTQN